MKLPSGPRILATKPDSNRQAFHVTRQPVSQEQQEIINMALADTEYINQCRQAKTTGMSPNHLRWRSDRLKGSV